MKGLNNSVSLAVAGLTLVGGVIVWGCGPDNVDGRGSTGGPETAKLSGEIKIDGSGTVFPIQAAMVELFAELNPDVKVSVGKAGTGAGMEKFIAGETDIADASRPIKQ